MFRKPNVTRVFICFCLAVFLTTLPSTAQSPGNAPVTPDGGSDEWENEILKARVAKPELLITGLLTAGDDDGITLILQSPQSVVVEVDGHDLTAELYDASGSLLASEASGPVNSFRIVQALKPGQYLVHLTGGEGSYRIFSIHQ